MKKVSDVFKSIRFAKGEPRGKEHSSTDDEEHYTVGEKEFGQQLQHAKKRAMQEGKDGEYDEGEYDREGDMAKSDLRSIIDNAKRLHDMIEDADNLPEWVQSKITKAEDYISTVANYMTAEMNEEVELQEGRPSQRHPLEGHEYHKKSNEELIGIAKDAHKAAEAMKSHNTQAENKYRDQANDSATVRYFRQKSGMPDWYKKKYGHVKEEVEQLEEKNVPTSPEKWAQAKAQAKAKFDVYPSAYANGWAAKKYKEMGGGWKSMKEEKEQIDEVGDTPAGRKALSSYVNKALGDKNREKGLRKATSRLYKDNYYGKKNEEVEQIDELVKQDVQQDAQTMDKFSFFKKHGVTKAKAKVLAQEEKDNLPFTPDAPKKNPVAKAGKYGVGYSTVKHLAKMAMQKQAQKMKKPIKEEEMSKKAQIVKKIAKKKDSGETFQGDPVLSTTITKNY